MGKRDRTSTWRITVALEEAHRPDPTAFRRSIDIPFVIAALREANGRPLNVRDFIERFLGYLPDKTESAKIRVRVQNSLDYLKVRGAVEQVKVPGKHGTCWKLTPAADNTRCILALNGEEPTRERIEHGIGLVRRWLDRLRRDGIIRSVKPPTGCELKWELVNWCDEVAGTVAR